MIKLLRRVGVLIAVIVILGGGVRSPKQEVLQAALEVFTAAAVPQPQPQLKLRVSGAVRHVKEVTLIWTRPRWLLPHTMCFGLFNNETLSELLIA